jgi:hypothetical protein
LLEGRRFVEVAAALGLPLPTTQAVTVAALTRALELGRGPFEAGPDLVGLQLGDRPLVALGGLSAALPQPTGDHRPVPLTQGLSQVLGLPRQTFTLKKLVSPSRRWPSCWRRWVTATRRLATAMPLLVKRNSGSSTRLPTTLRLIVPGCTASTWSSRPNQIRVSALYGWARSRAALASLTGE